MGVFFAHASGIFRLTAIDRLDRLIYDWQLRVTMPHTLDPRIVILDIDEKSLAEVGHWPWGRDKLARILDKLFDDYKIAIIGFDVVWAESDPSSGLSQLDQLARGKLKNDPDFITQLQHLRPSLNFDQRFADAIRNRPVVLGFFMSNDRDGRHTGVLPEPALPAGAFEGRPIQFTVWNGYGGNLPDLQKAAMAAGHINPIADLDGVVRRVPMLVEFDHQYYQSLSLAMVRALLGSPPIRPEYAGDENGLPLDYGGLESLDLPVKGRVLHIPVDKNVAALVPYRGPGNVTGGSYRYISLSDVLFDRVKPSELTGKIVLLGSTALGLLDMRSTPVNEVYPGVEIHANLISGMLDGTLKAAPEYTEGADIVLVLGVGLLLSFALPFLSVLRALALSTILGVALMSLNFWLYTRESLVLPIGAALLVLLSVFVINMVYGYFVESRSKRELAGLFGSYVPRALVQEMSRNPRAYSMEGKSEELTVMFCDVRGFTTLSEGLKPKDLSEYINEYLTSMSFIIQNYRGTLDKYIGDAIMAFWGAPMRDLRHASRAVEAAMAMQQEVNRLNETYRARNWPDMQVGIGISTGIMSVGDMGSKLRLAYTVMGDSVNLGSRLESLTKSYGVGIIVSDATRKATSGIVFREIDLVRVKGRGESIAIFEPLGREGEMDPALSDELRLWHQVLKAYRSRQWDAAEAQLQELLQARPDRQLYRVYAERITQLRAIRPDDDWAGVMNFSEK